MFYTQSTSTVISRRERGGNLMFYTRSTSTVISHRENSGYIYIYPGQEKWIDDVAKADVAFDD